MKIEELAVSGSFLLTPTAYQDDRGAFLEWFRAEDFADMTGHAFALAQANWSTSRRGVVRGIHYADVPPGQAKYVTCVRGSILDVVVDLRVGSATFGRHAAVPLSDVRPQALYLGEGLGHGFCALTDDATVLYLCSTGYAPAREHGINPLDPALGLPWPDDVDRLLSPKDAAAPTLAEALAAGTLPTVANCMTWIDSLAVDGDGVAR